MGSLWFGVAVGCLWFGIAVWHRVYLDWPIELQKV